MDIPVINLMLPLNSSVFIRGRNHQMSLQNWKKYFQASSVYIHSQFFTMKYQSKPQEGRRRLSPFSCMRLLLLIEIYNLILNTSLDPYTRSITLRGWIKEKTRFPSIYLHVYFVFQCLTPLNNAHLNPVWGWLDISCDIKNRVLTIYSGKITNLSNNFANMIHVGW